MSSLKCSHRREALWVKVNPKEWKDAGPPLQIIRSQTLWDIYIVRGFRLPPRSRWKLRSFLGYHATSSGNSLPTLRDNLSDPSSGLKNRIIIIIITIIVIVVIIIITWRRGRKNLDSWPLKMSTISCPETLVRNYHCSLCNRPEERSSQGER
jgi:hypothetical protein